MTNFSKSFCASIPKSLRIYFNSSQNASPVLENACLRIQWRLTFANVIRCSRRSLWVGYFIYFKFTPVFFEWMFFNSVQEINELGKEMSNICLKVSIEKKWPTQNFVIVSLKISSPGQFLGSSTPRRYHWIFCCSLKIGGLEAKLYVSFLLF